MKFLQLLILIPNRHLYRVIKQDHLWETLLPHEYALNYLQWQSQKDKKKGEETNRTSSLFNENSDPSSSKAWKIPSNESHKNILKYQHFITDTTIIGSVEQSRFYWTPITTSIDNTSFFIMLRETNLSACVRHNRLYRFT